MMKDDVKVSEANLCIDTTPYTTMTSTISLYELIYMTDDSRSCNNCL